MASGRQAGRVGLLFAALAGAGAASLVGSLLRSLPMAPALAADHAWLLIAAPVPIGAVVAVAHIYWLRGLLSKGPARPAEPAAVPIRTLVPPAEGEEGEEGEKPPRWRPVIRN